MSSLSVSLYSITISWLYPLNVFNLVFFVAWQWKLFTFKIMLQCRIVQRDICLFYESLMIYLKFCFSFPFLRLLSFLFKTSVAFLPLLGVVMISIYIPRRQVCGWNRDGTALNRDKSCPPSRQLWKRNTFGAVPPHNSSFGGGYANICVWWEKNEGDLSTGDDLRR